MTFTGWAVQIRKRVPPPGAHPSTRDFRIVSGYVFDKKWHAEDHAEWLRARGWEACLVKVRADVTVL